MEKIVLLLMLQFSLLISADFVFLNNGTITPKTTQTNTGSTAGVIRNSVDLMWEDMNGKNTGWVSNMVWGPQFKGPRPRALSQFSNNDFDSYNVWIEVEAAGNGSTCSPDINKATNTRVEIGTIRGYMLRNGVWKKFTEKKSTGGTLQGAMQPSKNQYLYRGRGCGYDAWDTGNWSKYKYPGRYRIEPSGFTSVKPKHYYRWHAWAPTRSIAPLSTLQGLYGVVYMRLVVEDPNKPDDRHLANYVAHIAGDRSKNNAYKGGLSLSRYKKITKDWQPFNVYTYRYIPTKAQLKANPPPVILKP